MINSIQRFKYLVVSNCSKDFFKKKNKQKLIHLNINYVLITNKSLFYDICDCTYPPKRKFISLIAYWSHSWPPLSLWYPFYPSFSEFSSELVNLGTRVDWKTILHLQKHFSRVVIALDEINVCDGIDNFEMVVWWLERNKDKLVLLCLSIPGLMT